VQLPPQKQKWRKREACANPMHLSRVLSGKYTRSKLYTIHINDVQHEVHSFLSKYWDNHSTEKSVCQPIRESHILWIYYGIRKQAAMKTRHFVFARRTFVYDEKMCTFHTRRFDA